MSSEDKKTYKYDVLSGKLKGKYYYNIYLFHKYAVMINEMRSIGKKIFIHLGNYDMNNYSFSFTIENKSRRINIELNLYEKYNYNTMVYSSRDLYSSNRENRVEDECCEIFTFDKFKKIINFVIALNNSNNKDQLSVSMIAKKFHEYYNVPRVSDRKLV